MLEPVIGQSLGWDRGWEMAIRKNDLEEHEMGQGREGRAEAVLLFQTSLGWMVSSLLAL